MQGRCVAEVLFSRQTRATVGDICWSWGAFEGAAEPGVTLMWQTTVLEYFLAIALHRSFAKSVLSTTRGVSNASLLPIYIHIYSVSLFAE